MNLSKNWEIFVIHHSHTDIGYTERQDKIIRYHVDFIRQALDILDASHSGACPQYKGFVWQCENYWQVKTFYDNATPAEKQRFETYVKSGEIGISGNYLNSTELLDETVLNTCLQKGTSFGEKISFPLTCAMTADINGFAWGYAQALAENGIENLFSCLHPHHGMFPLYKKQIPFYWESPQGKRVLVWNGEHYHFGNELCLCPSGGSSYMIFDRWAEKMKSGLVCCDNAQTTYTEEMACAADRLTAYLANLEQEGYPQNILPLMVSGAITDNAPPNGEIAARLADLNRVFDGKVTLKMATLEEFFARVRRDFQNIPVYRGDWNDWWADGVGSTPAVVKNYRDAQRKLALCKKLDPKGELGSPDLLLQAQENLALYAEHTWGYSSSVSEPWETLVTDLEMKKSAYAINANTQISENLDRILEKRGEVSIRAQRPQEFKVINPNHFPVSTTASLFVEFWEYLEGVAFRETTAFQVIDKKTGEVLPAQLKRIARAYQIDIPVSMEPFEEKLLTLQYRENLPEQTVQNHAHIGAEGIRDLLPETGYREDFRQVETDFFRISLEEGVGITSIIDKSDNSELLHPDREYAPFSGVYEVTKNPGVSACEVRRRMGRSRKTASTKRHAGTAINTQIVENGDVCLSVQIDYALLGTGFYQVFLTVYKHLPKIRARVRIHKHSVWEPENLYISLPFTAAGETWIDKTGCLMRPGIDQLPGTNMEFYLQQNGILFQGPEKVLALSVKDTPLLTFGSLSAKPIPLCTGADVEFNTQPAFAWAMNNYWETNFKVDLGGFYEFDFILTACRTQNLQTAVRQMELENQGLPAFYI